jgi:hypothetical protein
MRGSHIGRSEIRTATLRRIISQVGKSLVFDEDSDPAAWLEVAAVAGEEA